MAKQSLPESILDVLARPELCGAPLAVRGLLAALLVNLWRMRAAVFRFGARVPETTEFCLALSCTETELETGIENLIGRGILAREADGAIACPLLAGAFRSAETKRNNGLLGGRPRKGETAAQAAARRQGNLLLPMDVGRETKPKPDAQPQAKPQAKPIAQDKLQALAVEVEQAAGVTDLYRRDNVARLASWLADGADAELILRVVAEKAGRASEPVRGLRYFDAPVREALAAAGPAADAEFDWPAHTRALEAWQRGGCNGPMPRTEEFRKERA